MEGGREQERGEAGRCKVRLMRRFRWIFTLTATRKQHHTPKLIRLVHAWIPTVLSFSSLVNKRFI